MITGSYVQAIITLEAAIAHIDHAGHHWAPPATNYTNTPKASTATAARHANQARDLKAMHGRFGQGSTTSVASQHLGHPPSSQPTESNCNLYIPNE